jgi:endoglucanase
MIGISPTLDKNLSQKLINIADKNDIPHDVEIMAGQTGTNADMLSVSRCGVKSATVSIPLRNMHTEVETLHLGDITAVCDLLEQYILSGGVNNA